MDMGFTGTEHGMSPKQLLTFGGLVVKFMPTSFHHGDCVGADDEAALLIARTLKKKCHIVGHIPKLDKSRAHFPSDEEREPKPYLVRNHDIVDEVQVMIATPGEYEERLRSGTWATIRYSLKRYKRLIVIFPDGSTKEYSGTS